MQTKHNTYNMNWVRDKGPGSRDK